ncbi:hypothetical protein ES702_02404 [subsurface metagenome]
MTGGFELAVSADIVVACRDAVFRDNHAMCTLVHTVSPDIVGAMSIRKLPNIRDVADHDLFLTLTDGVHAIRGHPQLLPRLCGLFTAKMISLASIPVTAEQALHWNIISKLVDTVEDLMSAAMRIVDGLVYNKGPIIRKLKQTMQSAFGLSYGEARKLELQRDIEYYKSLGDRLSGVLAKGTERFDQRVKELLG